MSAPPKRLIVTADDLGLTEEISNGIFTAHQEGIVTAASLLMNAPATEYAIKHCRNSPGLEIGIHLGIVEGIALSGGPSTLTDELSYFPQHPCLHRHWKQFIARYVRGAIDMRELERELELQVKHFLEFFPSIPFANGTQHLHLLPGVREIVLRLAQKYKIGALRSPHKSLLTTWNARCLPNAALKNLGRAFLKRARAFGVRTTDAFAGFDVCGRVDVASLAKMCALLPSGTSEIMTHPGRDCAFLRENLPWGYADFSWEGELVALTAPQAREMLEARGISLIRFGELN